MELMKTEIRRFKFNSNLTDKENQKNLLEQKQTYEKFLIERANAIWNESGSAVGGRVTIKEVKVKHNPSTEYFEAFLQCLICSKYFRPSNYKRHIEEDHKDSADTNVHANICPEGDEDGDEDNEDMSEAASWDDEKLLRPVKQSSTNFLDNSDSDEFFQLENRKVSDKFKFDPKLSDEENQEKFMTQKRAFKDFLVVKANEMLEKIVSGNGKSPSKITNNGVKVKYNRNTESFDAYLLCTVCLMHCMKVQRCNGHPNLSNYKRHITKCHEDSVNKSINTSGNCSVSVVSKDDELSIDNEKMLEPFKCASIYDPDNNENDRSIDESFEISKPKINKLHKFKFDLNLSDEENQRALLTHKRVFKKFLIARTNGILENATANTGKFHGRITENQVKVTYNESTESFEAYLRCIVCSRSSKVQISDRDMNFSNYRRHIKKCFVDSVDTSVNISDNCFDGVFFGVDKVEPSSDHEKMLMPFKCSSINENDRDSDESFEISKSKIERLHKFKFDPKLSDEENQEKMLTKKRAFKDFLVVKANGVLKNFDSRIGKSPSRITKNEVKVKYNESTESFDAYLLCIVCSRCTKIQISDKDMNFSNYKRHIKKCLMDSVDTSVNTSDNYFEDVLFEDDKDEASWDDEKLLRSSQPCSINAPDNSDSDEFVPFEIRKVTDKFKFDPKISDEENQEKMLTHKRAYQEFLIARVNKRLKHVAVKTGKSPSKITKKEVKVKYNESTESFDGYLLCTVCSVVHWMKVQRCNGYANIGQFILHIETKYRDLKSSYPSGRNLADDNDSQNSSDNFQFIDCSFKPADMPESNPEPAIRTSKRRQTGESSPKRRRIEEKSSKLTINSLEEFQQALQAENERHTKALNELQEALAEYLSFHAT